MPSRRHRIVMLVICAIVAGCATARRMPSDGSERDRELSHGYSLLYNVVNKQSDLDKIFFLKRPPETTRALIEQIAEASRQAARKLRTFAENDPSLALDDQGLPVTEDNTRKAVEASTRNRLLFGDGFELRLLLTQAESSNYVAHLASTLAEADGNKDRAAELKAIAEQFRGFNDKVIARISEATRQTTTTTAPGTSSPVPQD